MMKYNDLYQNGLNDESERHCNGTARGTIYYGSISYSCSCLVKEHTKFENEPNYKPDRKLFAKNPFFFINKSFTLYLATLHKCLLIEYHAPDIGAPQTWAVSTFFLTIVIGGPCVLNISM